MLTLVRFYIAHIALLPRRVTGRLASIVGAFLWREKPARLKENFYSLPQAVEALLFQI